ncbi:major facilitator superfamily domain-containing protein [Boletus edulis]|nr:major facilitator superfamily domain-containing protein [Boletus edulis]
MSTYRAGSETLHIEEKNLGLKGDVSTSDDLDNEFGGKEARKRLERKLLWKLDLRMSILVAIYILNYVDRNNVGAARARGFTTDLHLVGQQFATLLSILYVGYIIMQIPSFVGALLTRFFLGFVEAAFFPGALFLISKWYKQDEIGLRTAILYFGNIMSNAFGALLASGILGGMNGVLGHAAWRWLFYIEGALTCFVAVCAIFILPDFPATTRWLTEEERRLAVRRMKEDVGVGDQGETETGGRAHGLYLAVTDWKVWLFALAATAQVTAMSFTAYFPTLTATLGYNPTVTLLLVAPPFVFTVIVAFWLSRRSDKKQERFYHMISSYIVGIIGFIIAISTMNTVARYVSLFLMAQSYAGSVVMYTWISSSFPRPPSKRAVCLSLINAFSQLGNVGGSYVWPSNWGPSYRYSYGICIACSGTAIMLSWVFREALRALNRELEEEDDDRGFRYIL